MAEEHRCEEDPEEDAPKLDPEAEARRVAAMSFIRKLGDPVLKSAPLRSTASTTRCASRWRGWPGSWATPYGVGLAAPQLGLSQRLLVYRVGPDAPVVALANPELEWTSADEETLDEGCLSIPGITVDVERPVYVRVRAQDEEGETRLVEASGLEARVIQHEMDHLNGVLNPRPHHPRRAQARPARAARGRAGRRRSGLAPLSVQLRDDAFAEESYLLDQIGQAWRPRGPPTL